MKLGIAPMACGGCDGGDGSAGVAWQGVRMERFRFMFRGVLGGRLIRIAQLRIDGAERDVLEFVEPKFGARRRQRRSGPRADQANVRGKWRGDRPRQDEHDVRAETAHGLGQAIAGGSEPTADEGRELPPEHENAHIP